MLRLQDKIRNYKMKRINKLILLFLFVLQGIVFPQSFSASVNNQKVGLNDQFQVSFTFSGNNINNIGSFKPPSFNNFMVLSGPNESTSVQIINSAVSATKTYSFYIRAKDVGKHTIGSASITYNGKSYTTNPLSIDVVKGSTQPQNNSTAQQPTSPNVSTKEIADNLFIKAIPDRRKVYLGEQVTVTYKLYTRLGIASQMSVNKLPQYSGCWAEELNTANTISFTTETYNGKQFRVGVLKKVALFPSQTGKLDVTPMELSIPVEIRRKSRSNDFFNNFFNDPFGQTETYDYDAKSNVIKLDVKPLPDKDIPPSFKGAVGDFTLSSSLDKKNVKTNEALNLKVTIAGTGNIGLLNTPEINLPAGFEQYEPKTKQQINREDKISGKKEITYLLVPRIAGKKEIPSIKFSYFDLNKEKYVTLATEPYEVNVEHGANMGGNNVAATQSDVKLLGDDIYYIKTNIADLEKNNGVLLFHVGFWVAAGLPLILLIGLVSFKKRSDRISSNLQLLKFQKAQKVAKARLNKAKEMMNEKNQNEFYSEISLTLFGYLEDKLNMPKSEFSLETAIGKLKSRKVSDSVLQSLKECAEKCEYIRFAPQKDGIAAMNEIYNDSANVIIEIEKTLSSRKS
jgi:hypothetical protein